ncbi:MAG: hypothetical protein AB1756_03580 [Acidobacteriota bacterium]
MHSERQNDNTGRSCETIKRVFLYASSLFFFMFLCLIWLMIFFPQLIAREEEGEKGVEGWKATRYEIDVTLDPEKQGIYGKVKIDIESEREVYSLRFLLNENLHILGAKLSSGILEYRKAGEVVTVDVDPPIRGKKSITFEIEGKIKIKAGAERPAFAQDSILLLGTDLWYPLSGEGGARSLIKVTLPAGFKVVGPGKMIEGKQVGDRITYTWQNDIPIQFCSIVADRKWVVRSTERGSVRVQTYLYPLEEGEFAERIASSATDIINCFSSLFCPNPFSQISIVELEGISRTRTLNGIILYSPENLIRIFSSEGFDARSIGYLWWGYLIGGEGPGGWQQMQGLGSYAEHLYCEKMGLPATDFMERSRMEYLLLDSKLDRPFAEVGPESPDPLIFGKGSAIMAMLRYVAGDEPFFKAAKLLFKEKIFTRMTLDELRETLEKGTDMDLGRFFRNWIASSGIPELKMEHSVRETYQKDFRVDLKIVQESGIYDLPVEILMAGREGRKVEEVFIDDRENKFMFRYSFRPDNIILDPQHKIFRREPDLKKKSLKLLWKEEIEKAIQEALRMERVKKYDEAGKIYEEALTSVGSVREILYNYARMEHARKNYEKALELYAGAAKAEPLLKEAQKDPLLPWSHIRRGNIYDVMGRRSKALGEYRKALEHPDMMDSKKTAERYIKKPYREE